MSYYFYLRQIVHGDFIPTNIALTKQAITLGGNEYPELKRFSKVSYPHAYIVTQQEKWYIKDLSSFYGTYVNGCRIGTDLYPLQIGDQIGLGSAECSEDGFVCALCVKMKHIKKEPLEVIDVSASSSAIKIEPDDENDEYDGFLPKLKLNIVLETKPEDGLKKCDTLQPNTNIISNMSPCESDKISDLLRTKRKVITQSSTRDYHLITNVPLTKINCIIPKTEPGISSCTFKYFKDSSSTSDEKGSQQLFDFTNIKATSNPLVADISSTDKSINIKNEPVENENSQNLGHSSSVLDSSSKDKSIKMINLDSSISNQLNSLSSLHNKWLQMDISKESDSKSSTKINLLSRISQSTPLYPNKINELVTSCSNKTYQSVGQKRLRLNLAEDDQSGLSDMNCTQSIALDKKLTSKSVNSCTQGQYEIPLPYITFGGSKNTKSVKCSDSVYSSDVTAFLKRITPDIENTENPETNKNHQNIFQHKNDNCIDKVVKDIDNRDLLIHNIKEEKFNDFTLEMDRIPNQSKICTNFLAPYVSVDRHLKCNRKLAESQNNWSGTNKLASHSTLPFNKHATMAESVCLRKTAFDSLPATSQVSIPTDSAPQIPSSNCIIKESSYENHPTFHNKKSPEKKFSSVFEVPNAYTFFKGIEDSNICFEVTENPKFLISSTPPHCISKNTSCANILPLITDSKLVVPSSVSPPVLKDISSLAKKDIPMSSSVSTAFGTSVAPFNKSTVIPFISNDSPTVDSNQTYENKVLKTHMSIPHELSSNQNVSSTNVCASHVNRKEINKCFNTIACPSSNANVSVSLEPLNSYLNLLQQLNWVNNGKPVSLTEENTSCVNLLSNSENTSNVAVLKKEKEANLVSSSEQKLSLHNSDLKSIFNSSENLSSSQKMTNFSQGTERLIKCYPASSKEESVFQVKVDKDDSPKTSPLGLFFVSEINNTETTAIKESSLPNSDLSRHNKLLDENMPISSFDRPGTLSVSQNSESLNNWMPVSLTEENTSCVNLLPNSEDTSNVSVLKIGKKANSVLPSEQERSLHNSDLKSIFSSSENVSGSQKTTNFSQETERLIKCYPASSKEESILQVEVDKDDSPKISSLGLHFVSDINNTETASIKKSSLPNSDLSRRNKLLDKNMPISSFDLQRILTVSQDSEWLNNSLTVTSNTGDTFDGNRLPMNVNSSALDLTSVPESVSETSLALSANKLLNSDFPLLTIQKKILEQTTSPPIEVLGSLNVLEDSKCIPLIHSIANSSTEKSNFPICNFPTNNVRSVIPSISLLKSTSKFVPVPSTSKEISISDSNSVTSHNHKEYLKNIDIPTIHEITPISNSDIDKAEVNDENLRHLENELFVQNKDNMNLESKSAFFNLIKNVVEFDVDCCEEKKDDDRPPSVLLKGIVYLPLHFRSFEHYVSSFLPLLVLEVWQIVHDKLKQIWKNSTYNLFNFTILSFKRRSFDLDEYHCEALVDQSTFAPAKGNVVLMEIKTTDNKHFNGCFYISRHSVKEPNDNVNPHSNKESNMQVWRFSVFAKPHANPPRLNELMKGNGIGSVQRYIYLSNGFEYLATSPLCASILDPNSNILCEPSRTPLKLSQSEAVSEISNDIQNSSSESKVLLLKGAPGTGKTQTIVNLIEKLVTEDKKTKILVICASDTLLDDIGRRLLRLKMEKFVIRLGETHRASKELYPICLDFKVDSTFKRFLKKKIKKVKGKKNLLNNKMEPHDIPLFSADSEPIKERFMKSSHFINRTLLKHKATVFMQAQIFLSTLSDCKTLFSKSIRERTFSCCIVDDATRYTEIEVLQCVVAYTNKLLLVGDPRQILANSYSRLSASYGFERSMFARFNNYFYRHQKKNLVFELKEQFRMNSEIWHFPSKQFFSNKLPSVRNDNWPFSVYFQHSYFVYDVRGGPITQVFDEIIYQICLYLRRIKKTAASIGIITLSQNIRSHCIEQIFKNNSVYNHIEVNTIDAFMGREKDIIILSCDQSELATIPNFFSCEKNMIEALTRARNCLFVCIASTSLQCVPAWQCLIDDAKNRKVYEALHSVKSIRTVIKKTIAPKRNLKNKFPQKK